ncbi:MAG: DUF1929 domain-containing protein [Phycisphaerales bacterium]|nr:DUF1929 domain-containing protein [Phycisphaerales bacterium]
MSRTRCSIFATLAMGLAGGAATTLAQSSVEGAWESQMSWGIRSVHLIMLRTGEVLVLDQPQTGQVDTALFNPTTGALTTSVPQQITDGRNVFCSGHSQTATGSILIVGGDDSPPGTVDVFLYDPSQPNQSWNARRLSSDSMPNDRWYPTCTTLGSGKILISGGRDDPPNQTCDWPDPVMPANRVLLFDITKAPGERYSEPETGSVPIHEFMFYPYMAVRSNGQVLYAGSNDHVEECNLPHNSYQLNISSGAWSLFGEYFRYGTSAAIYKPDGVVKIGTNQAGETGTGYCSDQARKSAWKQDSSSGQSTWTQLPCMNRERTAGQLLVFPDGKIGVFGGAYEGTDDQKKRPEWTDPDASPALDWTALAPGQTIRAYHSAAVLLPDARVLFAGGEIISTAEIFKPPYLFKADNSSAESLRPVITAPAANALVKYDTSFDITLNSNGDYADIEQVVLMRLGAATHSFDQDARRVPLEFTLKTINGPVQAAAPAHSHLAPPGYYMLFVLKQGDRAGIQFPSVARIVRVGAS